jgi:hypothetical protein
MAAKVALTSFASVLTALGIGDGLSAEDLRLAKFDQREPVFKLFRALQDLVVWRLHDHVRPDPLPFPPSSPDMMLEFLQHVIAGWGCPVRAFLAYRHASRLSSRYHYSPRSFVVRVRLHGRPFSSALPIEPACDCCVIVPCNS